MSSKKLNTLGALLAAALSVTSTPALAGASGEDQTPSIEFAHQNVAGNVSVISGVNGFSGGNVAVLSGEDGLLIVDDMLAGFEGKLAAVLSTR